VKTQSPKKNQEVTRETFTFELDKAKLKEAELRDPHYLLRTNLVAEDPKVLWDHYMQLTQIEAAFKCLKSELGPICHQLEKRVEAHAPGLTPRAVLEKLAAIQILDVWLPTTGGRHLVMPRNQISRSCFITSGDARRRLVRQGQAWAK